MQRKHKLIIIGDSAFAEIAYEYFMHDSDYEVVSSSFVSGQGYTESAAGEAEASSAGEQLAKE